MLRMGAQQRPVIDLDAMAFVQTVVSAAGRRSGNVKQDMLDMHTSMAGESALRQ